MLKYKNPLLKVRCLECKEEQHIKMEHLTTDKVQRTIGFEYEHVFRGETTCSHCEEKLKVLSTIFEFPKDTYNYHDINSEACLVIDTFNEDSFDIDSNIQYETSNVLIDGVTEEYTKDTLRGDIAMLTMDMTTIILSKNVQYETSNVLGKIIIDGVQEEYTKDMLRGDIAMLTMDMTNIIIEYMNNNGYQDVYLTPLIVELTNKGLTFAKNYK
jgi:hypothetical protein